MPRGGIRPRRTDGSTNHLLKPKWKSGHTRTIRVPVAMASQLLEIAHRLDEGESLDLTQDNGANTPVNSIELTQDKKPEGSIPPIDMTHDNITDWSRLKAKQLEALALLQSAITPKSKGGSYAANNATGIKRLVEQALALLVSSGD